MRARRNTLFVAMTFALAGYLLTSAGCQGWVMDYGEPAAQFESTDAAAAAREYLGQKVSIRGAIVSVDTTEPPRCVVELEGGVTAALRDWQVHADWCRVGEVAYIDGVVEGVTPGKVTLEPAMGRDHSAPFDPERR